MTQTTLFRLKRFFREQHHPEERCQRLGHFEQTEKREGFSKPENYRSDVADEVKQERIVCGWCNKVIKDWETKKRHGIQGLTMSSRCHEELREKGFTYGG